ncbi:complement component 1 Q subcomponent-binding protein, mitochondrial [Cephus cinctus]|uniref:Complement component 1 Q subcomponent-binding protein, mitochondrial n=1 Tax=Cephus cinctus TaxID=211228 RepID=A0AAJ7RNI6_CEPCN|nr:complement component 1 Q subcomponent-binding protein, mitochondrial [Cephus cinctus]XP_024943561.1 complement component 1 Q subcomponent-binding protein, mitochondrial [Cephus cinctus]
MNGIVRNALRVSALKSIVSPTNAVGTAKRQFTRTLWNMCNRHPTEAAPLTSVKIQAPSELCSCGCGSRGAHTKAEKDLVEFLAEEIVAEKKAQKLRTIPTEVDGFKVSLDGAEVTLTKQQDGETIKINFNVNHTVDTDAEPEIDPNDDKPDIGDMKSKPNFEVDIIRGKQTLGFTCSFNNEPGASGADDNYNDIFGIDEITLYEGEHSDKVYAVAGEVVDAYLYDLLMNYLEEKGISNEFGEKLIELSTSYEHSAYISLLEGLSKFTSSK